MSKTVTNNGLATWLAVLAGLSNLAGASIMFDVLGPKWSGLFLSVIGSLNAGTAAWIGYRKPLGPRPDVTPEPVMIAGG